MRSTVLLVAFSLLAAGEADDPRFRGSPYGALVPHGLIQWKPGSTHANEGKHGCIGVFPVAWMPDPTTALFRQSPSSRMGSSPAHEVFNGSELAVTYRAGIGRFRFTQRDGSVPERGWVVIASSCLMSASVTGREAIAAGGRGMAVGSKSQDYVQYAAILFDRDPVAVREGVYAETADKAARPIPSLAIAFDLKGQPEVLVKIGVSWTSAAAARTNRDTEIPDWDFERVRAAGSAAWRAEHDRLRVTVTPELKPLEELFTKCWADVSCSPRGYDDADGGYLGFDDRPRTAPSGHRYQWLPGWDYFRSIHPLLCLIRPDIGGDVAQSFIDQAQSSTHPQGGGWGRWTIGNRENGCMEGDPACMVIGHSYAFGARNFQIADALTVMERVATTPGIESSPGFRTRPGLESYLKHGYASRSGAERAQVTTPWGYRGSADGISGTGGRTASQTLDYAMADFAIHRLALAEGKTALAERMLRQAQHWKAVIDPATKTLPQEGSKVRFDGYAEGAWDSYQGMVPHNLARLIEAMGGPAAASAVFERLIHFPYNQQMIHNPWAWNWCGEPWKTQAKTRQVLLRHYFTAKTGNARETPEEAARPFAQKRFQFPSSNDHGCHTAYGIWLALGIFPSIPGVGGFTVGSPMTPKAVITRPDGWTLTIITEHAAPENAYVQSLTVNGKPHTGTWIPWELLTQQQSNELRFVMGAEPNTAWGLDPKPPSFDAKPWHLGDR